MSGLSGADREILVRKYVRKHGLQYAPEPLRADRELVLEAVKQIDGAVSVEP